MAIALWLVARNASGALLCLLPWLQKARETSDDGSLDPENEPAMERFDAGLRALGFAKLGAIELCAPLAPPRARLIYGAPALNTFADLEAPSGSLHLTLFTPFEGGEAVVTSNFQRSGHNTDTLLLGGLPGHEVREVWAAHRRRVAQLTDGPRHAVPWNDLTLPGRVRAQSRYVHGSGKRELRARGVVPLTVVLMALVLMALAVLQLARLK